jgi:hypothetical protein
MCPYLCDTGGGDIGALVADTRIFTAHDHLDLILTATAE